MNASSEINADPLQHLWIKDINDIVDIGFPFERLFMPSLIVRNIPVVLKEALRIRAAENGHSIEEEVRVILRHTLREAVSGQRSDTTVQGMGTRIRDIAMKAGGVELELPERSPMREPPEL